MNDAELTGNVRDNESAATSTEAQRNEETRSGSRNVEPPLSKRPPFALRWLSHLILVPLVGAATAAFGCVSLEQRQRFLLRSYRFLIGCERRF